MKNKIFLLVLASFLFFSCNKNPSEQILGSWKGETGNGNIKFSVSYTFNSDGTGKVNLMNFQGDIKEYKIYESQGQMNLHMIIIDPLGNEKTQKRKIEFTSENVMKIIQDNDSYIILNKQ